MTSDASTTPDPTTPRFARSREGRLVAGVCGGFGRATGTDPLLWRVLVGVLVVFGVLGHWAVAAVAILAYLAGWLLLPDEGDEASPLEALLGRGRSSASTAVTVMLLIGAVLTAATLLGNTSVPAVLLLASAGVLAYYLYRKREPVTGAAPVAPSTASPPPPSAEPTTVAYSPGFAPHGPYAEPATAPLPPAPPKPRKPREPRERSVLGRVTVSLVLLVLGGLTVADLLGASVPADGYVAGALGVVALGLLVGAVAGRARGLIALGILLALALGVTTAAERVHGMAGRQDGDVTWRPVAVSTVQATYEHGFGNTTLDLRAVAFRTTDRVATRVSNGAGNVTVLLPPGVDVTVRANVGAGRIDAFGPRSEGLGREVRTADSGADGPGGGRLDLRIELGAGNVEVRREAA